ncbi:MAG TPA: hypothetical protein VFS04_07830 [Alphaproteobacteria bacterium]|nr:hypothetical protein [Alphaproteobacteria bacterium]
MQRRGFLGMLSGALAAGPNAVKAALDNKVLAQAGFPSGAAGAVASCAPSEPIMPTKGAEARVLRWIRKNGVPDWKMNEIKMRANAERALGLDPDLACLISVSAGWKAREQRRRTLERMTDMSIANALGRRQRRNFFDFAFKKFGFDVEWYD